MRLEFQEPLALPGHVGLQCVLIWRMARHRSRASPGVAGAAIQRAWRPRARPPRRAGPGPPRVPRSCRTARQRLWPADGRRRPRHGQVQRRRKHGCRRRLQPEEPLDDQVAHLVVLRPADAVDEQSPNTSRAESVVIIARLRILTPRLERSWSWPTARRASLSGVSGKFRIAILGGPDRMFAIPCRRTAAGDADCRRSTAITGPPANRPPALSRAPDGPHCESIYPAVLAATPRCTLAGIAAVGQQMGGEPANDSPCRCGSAALPAFAEPHWPSNWCRDCARHCAQLIGLPLDPSTSGQYSRSTGRGPTADLPLHAVANSANRPRSMICRSS